MFCCWASVMERSVVSLPGEILHVTVFGQARAPRSVQHLDRLVVIHGATHSDQVVAAFRTENLSAEVRMFLVDLRHHVLSLGLPFVGVGDDSPDGTALRARCRSSRGRRQWFHS